MKFAEVFLRLGSSLVAWMMLYAYVLWLATLNTLGCGPDGDEMHRLLLGMAPAAFGFALLLRVTRSMPEVHSIIRWLAAPLLLLMPLALMSIWKVFARADVESLSICSNNAAVLWERAWAPVQLLSIILIAYLLMRVLKVHPANNNKGK